MISISYHSRISLIVFLLFFISCKETRSKLEEIKYTTHKVDNSISEDQELTNIILPYKKQLDAKMNNKLSYTSIDLKIEREVNTLGNFVCDASMEYVVSKKEEEIDICIMNNGGLRAAIFKGDITARNIFKLMPFDNKLVVVTMKGEAMQELFDLVAQRREAIGGFVMKVENDSPVNPMINGQLFDFDKEYKVLTSDYLFYGGDNMTFFQKGSNFQDLNLMMRDVLLDYCKEYPNGITVDTNPRYL